MAIQELSIEQYRELFEDKLTEYSLIDVRELDEFQKVRMPNTSNIPLSQFQFRFNEIPTDKPLILVCQTGVRSLMAARFMNANGYDEIYNFTDGTLGWMQRGLPIEQG